VNQSVKKVAIENAMPKGSTQSAPQVNFPRTGLGINGLFFGGLLSAFLVLLMLATRQYRFFVQKTYCFHDCD